MAIYHLSVKAISRAVGRSATGAAAYRAAEKIVDERTGLVHDFTRKQGVEHTELILPDGTNANRAAFWNRLELHHKRRDAVVAREVEVALPDELTEPERRALAIAFARELAKRYCVAADVAIHKPSREGDERNHHAHIMLSACMVGQDGNLGKKAVELDPIHCERHKIGNMADRERVRWAEMTNTALERAGHRSRIDHRSLEAQGIERIPMSHMGPAVAGMARRGVSSEVGLRIENEISERLQRARQAGELERQAQELDRAILDTSGDLAAAVQARDAMLELKRTAADGIAQFRTQYEKHKQSENKRKQIENSPEQIENSSKQIPNKPKQIWNKPEQIEDGKEQALRAFQQFKAEQQRKQEAELAHRKVCADELSRQRQEGPAKGRDEQEPSARKKREPDRGPSL